MVCGSNDYNKVKILDGRRFDSNVLDIELKSWADSLNI